MRMLDCSAVQDRYSDFMENTLPADEIESVKDHLAQCPICQNLFQSLNDMLQKIRQLPQSQTSSDFNDKLLNRINNSEQATFWHKVYSSPISKAGSFAAAAGLVIALLFTQWMEPVNFPGQSEPAIASSPQGDLNNPVLAEQIDSSQSGINDSLNLQDPSQYIDPDKLQLVNDER